MSRGTPPESTGELEPIDPPEITIRGSTPLSRTVHRDARGFLVETLRSDDASVNGARFSMSYTSMTVPGEFRDAHQWHVHKKQTDRFVVVYGEMMLALFDQRPDSPTQGVLEVIRMNGASTSRDRPETGRKEPETIYLVPIPPGVLHCIGNLSEEPFLLQNYPTELYNPADEGRIPFISLPVKELGVPFAWTRVRRGPGRS